MTNQFNITPVNCQECGRNVGYFFGAPPLDVYCGRCMASVALVAEKLGFDISPEELKDELDPGKQAADNFRKADTWYDNIFNWARNK